MGSRHVFVPRPISVSPNSHPPQSTPEHPSDGSAHAALAPDALATLAIVPLPGDATPALFNALAAMLHRAYAEQVRMGLQPLAGRQDAETTARRCRSGEAWLATIDGRIDPVGMILLHEVEDAAFPPWFLRSEVAHFSLLAVDPLVQHAGIGARLVAHAEQRCAANGHEELALSMAEPDTRLLGWYVRRGYRVVDHWQWPYTNYRSLIMSRRLVTTASLAPTMP